MKNTARKMVLLITVYILLMTFFVTEEQNIFQSIAQNFYSLSIYKPF